MRLIANIKRDFVFMKRLIRILRRIHSVSPDSSNLLCDDFEKAAAQYPDRVAVLFEGKTLTYQLTYQQLNTLANRYAHWGRARGLKPGDTVALFLPNRIDYISAWLGLNKIGVISALINNSLTGAGLAHCINISMSSLTIVDRSTLAAFQEIAGQCERHQALWCLDLDRAEETDTCRSLDPALRGVSSVRPDDAVRMGIKANAWRCTSIRPAPPACPRRPRFPTPAPRCT